MNLGDVMDEIGDRLDTIDGLRVYRYPPDKVSPPAAVVTYPDEYTYDETYRRGMDRITLPVIVLVGRPSDRTSRDRIAAYLNGTDWDSVKARIEYDPRSYLSLHSVSPFPHTRATTPDDPSFHVTDLDVRMRVALDDWTPSPLTTHMFGQSSQVAGEKSWVASVHASGAPRLAIYPDGTDASLIGPEATAAYTFENGEPGWLRMTALHSNGSGNSVFNYYTSTDGETWDQLGDPDLLDDEFDLFNTTVPLAAPPSTVPMVGRVYYAELRDGIDGTVVANPDFSRQAPGVTSFEDTAGNVWTPNYADLIRAEGDGRQDPIYTAFDTARVTGAEFDLVSIGGTEHVAATLSIDITGPGG